MDAADMASAPIHSINSGPAMAPIAGRAYAQADSGVDTAIIADTGGTTFDVSLVRGGPRIPWTRETWIGQPYRGHMTGFPAVDVKSIGAGGGSIAWVDEGGLLHVGPKSAGARARPGLLRRRRHGADRDRRLGGPRLDRPRLLPRRHHGAGDRGGGQRHRDPRCEQARPLAPRGGGGDHERRHREHGACHRGYHGQTRASTRARLPS